MHEFALADAVIQAVRQTGILSSICVNSLLFIAGRFSLLCSLSQREKEQERLFSRRVATFGESLEKRGE